MSNTRKQQPEKISADCPHCGYSQLESAYAKSTICKRCSQHFSIEKLLAKEVSSLKPPSVFERLGKLIARESEREISCFSCGAKQIVSTAAESSLCPKCGSYIDLRDFRISGPFGRTVQTQGTVTILPKGEVTTRILCGKGRIEGKMRGTMISSGTIEIKIDGRLPGQVEAEKVVVEKKSTIEFAKPVKARAIEIDGKVTGQLVCDGRVTINKHGLVNGTIYARAIVVEKGGILSGELHIGEPEGGIPQGEEEMEEESLSAGRSVTEASVEDVARVLAETEAEAEEGAVVEESVVSEEVIAAAQDEVVGTEQGGVGAESAAAGEQPTGPVKPKRPMGPLRPSAKGRRYASR